MMSDEINLENATLFGDSSRGQYIPQFFAKNVKRDLVTGVSDEDYRVLEAGPDHDHYWEAWADVCDNAIIQDPKQGKSFLHHDGDLWIVPEVEEKIVLGHKFRPMTKSDWDGFAGADPGSLICSAENAVLILAPDGTVHEHATTSNWEPTEDNPNGFEAYVWTKERIV